MCGLPIYVHPISLSLSHSLFLSLSLDFFVSELELLLGNANCIAITT